MGDRVIWVVFFFLCIISLVETYSAASLLSYKTGRFWDPLVKQSLILLGGSVIVMVVHHVPCRMFKILPILLLPFTLMLLGITLLTGEKINDGTRWISIFGIQFQPSEIAKWIVVVSVALILSRMQEERGANKRAIIFILLISLPFIVLIMIENLSTACLLFGVVVLMMFIGRVPLSQLGKMFGVIALIGLLAGSVLYFAPKVVGSDVNIPILHRVETWESRLEDHFADTNAADKDDPMKYDLTKGAQVAHANIAIASSNGIGRMPGNSVERDFLPQAFSDFIFAIIIEEMGIWGGAIVVFLYIILLFRAGRISSRCERNFPPFLIMGLTLMLVSQAMLNMLVAVGLFPVTGQTLPLVSLGGTSTLITCLYIGMILSVSRYAKQLKEAQHTSFDGSMDDIKHE